MATRDVVVVGASAGGVEALRALVSRLPAELPAAVLVVLHVPRSAPSALARILDRAGPLPAETAVDGEPLRHGRVYVAATDRHLLVIDGRVRLSPGPAENGHRPAIDPLFRSAARAYGPRTIGVVLSGSRDDGAAGLAAIARSGGLVLVQDPADALHASMPRAAMEQVSADHVAPAAKLGDLIADLTRTEVPEVHPDNERLDGEVAVADFADLTTDTLGAEPAGYGCPSCGGALYQVEGTPVPRFRCRVGHAWSPDSLVEEQAVALEGALWVALRALKDKAALADQMARSSEQRGNTRAVHRYRGVADEAAHGATLIRELIERLGAAAAAEDAG